MNLDFFIVRNPCTSKFYHYFAVVFCFCLPRFLFCFGPKLAHPQLSSPVDFFNTFTAIKTALKQENLNPEIEEKLLQLQRFQEKQMKQEPDSPSPVVRVVSSTPVASINRFPPAARKRPPSTSKNDDADWVMEQPKRSRPSKTIEVKKPEIVVL